MELNKRFPHTLKVFRSSKGPDGEYRYDTNGNVILTPVILSLVEEINGDPVFDEEGRPVIGSKSLSINFGYRTATQNVSMEGDVVEAGFKVATPMFTTYLETGDILEVTDYDRTYRAEVVKKTTFNWGSNIWFNEVKN